MLDIATRYDAARLQDCRTAGLTAPMSESQTRFWWDYLFNFSIALAGCPLVVEPLPGGILVFGPANTEVVGLPHSPLARDDVERLIDAYVDQFAPALALSPDERAAVEAHLRVSAESEIVPGATSLISQCATDAGSP